MMAEEYVVPFVPEEVKNYLDLCIRYNRREISNGNRGYPVYYVDAYQSVRSSLFGELLPEETPAETEQRLQESKDRLNSVRVPVSTLT